MSLDRRYPWLYRIDDAPRLEPHEKVRAKAIAEQVARRTLKSYCFDAGRGKLHFYDGEPDTGVFTFMFKPVYEREAFRISEADIDDMVRLIQMGKRDAKEKDRIRAANEAAEKQAKEQFDGEFLEGNRKDALDYAGFLDRKRRGTQKVTV